MTENAWLESINFLKCYSTPGIQLKDITTFTSGFDQLVINL